MAQRLTACILVILLAFSFALGAFAETYPVLSRGSRDGAGNWSVYSLQRKLIDLYYMEGEPDGIYGAGTEKAVRAFQEANGLPVTGIADDETQQLLFSNTASADVTEKPAATPGGAAAGARGNDIYIIQSFMYMWGFSTDAPDGKYGAATRKAVSEFMNYAYEDMVAYTRERRAAATPEPTPVPTPAPTLNPGEMPHMADVIDELQTPEPTIPSDGTITDEWLHYMEKKFNPVTVPISAGSSGIEVKRMQRRLAALKYIAAGVDGGFGGHTEVALKYFQRRNGLEETGVLDIPTQETLYSNTAISSDQYVSFYKALISIKDQRVYIYKWTGSDYTKLEHTFICSTGTEKDPTILGTFQASGRNGEWYYFKDSHVWARYAFVIEGGYFFHSVLYNQKGGEPTSSSVRNLGKRASHGCIRLQVEDAKWIYDNCAAGMTVVIYDD